MGSLVNPYADDPEFVELRRGYILEALRDARELIALQSAAGGSLPAGDAGRRFRKLAHDLRGSGGSYGFPIVSLHAGEAEETYLDGGTADVLGEVLRMLERSILEAGRIVGVEAK